MNLVFKQIGSFILLLVLATTIKAQPQSVDMKMRKAYIDSAFIQLKKYRPDGMEQTAEYIPLGSGMHRYFIRESGLLMFDSGEWLYVTSHSGHKDARIGDLIMAIDNQGRTYYVPDHVCGGVLITFTPLASSFTLEDILNAKVNDHQGMKKIHSRKVIYMLPDTSH